MSWGDSTGGVAAAPRRAGWPSAANTVRAAIDDQFDQVWVATRFPAETQELARADTRVVRVVRNGGTRDLTTDRSRLLIDVIARGETAAEDLAELIGVWLCDARPILGAGALLDSADCEIAPTPVPYPDPEISQFSGVYVTSARRLDAV